MACAQQFNKLNCDYEISLRPDSVIEECPGDPTSSALPTLNYMVRPLPYGKPTVNLE